MHEVYNALREAAEKDLRKLAEKPDISSTEWANAKTLLSAMCKMNQLEERSYDGDSYSYRIPHISMERDMSTRRGRNPKTGRYVSMDNRPYYYDDGMSGHSITDRMVDLIERMYDSAETEHERRELDKWISRIRNGD